MSLWPVILPVVRIAIAAQMSADGEDIGLYYIDGRTIDTYTYDAQNENISWGRTTDAGTTWNAMETPTPGQTNN